MEKYWYIYFVILLGIYLIGKHTIASIEFAEADTFFCFTGLMSEIRDFFIKTLDESEMGIYGLMNRLMSKLKECDPQVWNRLKNLELEPQYFSFR